MLDVSKQMIKNCTFHLIHFLGHGFCIELRNAYIIFKILFSIFMLNLRNGLSLFKSHFNQFMLFKFDFNVDFEFWCFYFTWSIHDV